MSDAEDLEHAIELWREAYRRQMAGDFDEAITLYRRSLAVRPTAEAHTFLGWTYSFQGRLDDATAECLKAIKVDPDFGNPYNDIGVYLMQQGKLDDAVPWLEKAKRAPRYEPRQFPFMNLGRIYVRQGHWWKALREFEGAVAAAPEDAEAHKALHGLRANRGTITRTRRTRSTCWRGACASFCGIRRKKSSSLRGRRTRCHPSARISS